MNNYKKFVQTYTDIKEVVNTKNKLKDFYRIIMEQEKIISDHMRYNFYSFQAQLWTSCVLQADLRVLTVLKGFA